jgi:lipopolysaccharide/colanic/teichoic acid biosynthesis glycosyltransferase
MFSEIVNDTIVCENGSEHRTAALENILISDYSRRARDPESHLSGVTSPSYRIVKCGLDRVCAIALFAAFALPGLVIATTIALDSKGPIFYREWRIGRGGRPFKIWKFRSMQTTHLGIQQAQPDEDLLKRRVEKDLKDSRITVVGGFLRRWSLDELPQLLNVICGDMSLIGPRPVIDEEMALYGEFRHYYFVAKPGMSGLWQVSGRNNVDFKTRIRLDASYVQDWSLCNDFRILIRTIPVVLRRTGAR